MCACFVIKSSLRAILQAICIQTGGPVKFCGELTEAVLQCGSVVICRSSPAQKAAIVRMMMEYEMSQAEGGSKGLLKWYHRQMKKQARSSFPHAFHMELTSWGPHVCMKRTSRGDYRAAGMCARNYMVGLETVRTGRHKLVQLLI